MADQIKATPRSPILGLFSDIVNLPLQYMSSPERTQQMQGTAQFLYGTGIPKTLERMSYGDSLFSGAGGLGGTTRMRPETAEALMNVAPLAPAVARLANRAVKATEGLPIGMSIKPIGSVPKTSMKTESTPKVAMTSDGYKFYEQPDGTYTNGDMTFESLDELFSTDPQLTVNGKIYSPKAYFEEEAKGTPINPLYDDLFQEPNPLTSPFADLYKKGYK